MLPLVVALTVASGATAHAAGPGPVDPRLFVIGDSVLLGAKEAITAALPGWSTTVYAQDGLSTLAAPAIISANRPAIGQVVVVALGNNDMGNAVTFGHRVDGVMQALAGVQHVIWVNLRRFASWVPAMDDQLSQATARWPNLEIADWDSRATPDTTLVYGDGLHLTAPGQAAMATLVAQRLDAYVQTRVAATSTTTSPPEPSTSVPPPPRRSRGGSGSDTGTLALLGGVAVAAAVAVVLVGRRRRRSARLGRG